MKTRITPAYGLALAALMFLSQEMRMQLRFGLSRLVCGCWGTRSFSNWASCPSCTAPAASVWLGQAVAVGLPFIQLWVGHWLLGPDQSPRRRAWGLALVLAAMPLARLASATLAAGPEAYTLRQLLGDWGASWLLTIGLVLALIIPPALRANDALPAQRRGLTFLVLLVGPVLLNFLAVTQVLDPLLTRLPGFGVPLGWLLLTGATLAFSFRHLLPEERTLRSKAG